MAKGISGKLDRSLRRIHVPGLSRGAKEISLSGKQRHYLCNVLRMGPGDPLLLFDGSGWEFRASIISVHPGSVKIAIEQQQRGKRESPARIALAIGLLKAQKMDLVVQKASELGVYEILPVSTRRTVPALDAERAGERRTRWEKISLEASRQCGRSQVSRIGPVVPYEEVIHRADETDLAILFSAQSSGSLEDIKSLRAGEPARILVLLGPEGGFSDIEERMAVQQGFHSVCLGPRILRAETAAIVALSMVQYRFGDLGEGAVAAKDP